MTRRSTITRRALTAASVASLVFASIGIASAHPRAAAPAVSQTQEVVQLLGPQQAHSKPTAHSKTVGLVPARTPITEERTTLPVIGTYGDVGQWLLVRLPGRPNGHTGWISDHRTTVSVTAWHLVVDLTARTLTVYHAGRPVKVVKAVVGKPSTPTPSGDYFVEETIALKGSEVGAPFALALSARSNVLQDFEGGPGQIALHGLLNVGGVPGTAVSHGCIRLDNATMVWLSGRISPGTPVTIRS
jgi:lipoprotein-anchoring transpeptidase ErfK/SrfK